MASQSMRLLILLLLSTVCLPAGCSLPRVIVLEDPLTPQEHLNLGVAYEKKGQYDLAIKEYKQAARKLPLAYLYLGNVYFAKNAWGSAEKHYKKAIKKMPENADGYNNLAWLYYTKGENLKRAESLALKALELNPAKEEIYRDTLQKIRTALNKQALDLFMIGSETLRLAPRDSQGLLRSRRLVSFRGFRLFSRPLAFPLSAQGRLCS